MISTEWNWFGYLFTCVTLLIFLNMSCISWIFLKWIVSSGSQNSNGIVSTSQVLIKWRNVGLHHTPYQFKQISVARQVLQAYISGNFISNNLWKSLIMRFLKIFFTTSFQIAMIHERIKLAERNNTDFNAALWKKLVAKISSQVQIQFLHYLSSLAKSMSHFTGSDRPEVTSLPWPAGKL